MRDFLGRELAINDYVVFMRPNYRELMIGKVVKITAKRIRVEYEGTYGSHDVATDSILVVRVDPEEMIVLKLKGKV